jgi:hypothetical protein
MMGDWLERKDWLLGNLDSYIAQCSGLEPVPFDYIEHLHQMRAWIQTANEGEMPGAIEWWNCIAPRPAAISQPSMPGLRPGDEPLSRSENFRMCGDESK